MQSTFGNMDAAEAFASLPDDAKDHLYAKHDFIADNTAALHSTLKTERRQKKQALRNQIINPDITIAEAENLKAQLLDLKDSKLHYRENPTNGYLAHNDSLRRLRTYHQDRQQDDSENDKPGQIYGNLVLERKIRKLLTTRS